MDQLIALALWVLAVLVSVALSTILTDPTYWLLARILGGILPARPRNVTGLWQVPYRFEDAGNRETEAQIIELRQLGTHVFGKTIASTHHKDVIRGSFRHEIYFSGTWRSIKRGQIYHGTFQLILHPLGQKLEGRWLGFSKKNVVKHGRWTWTLLSAGLNKTEKQKIVDQHLANPTGRSSSAAQHAYEGCSIRIVPWSLVPTIPP